MIPPAFVHELTARVDIVHVIGRYVQLKKAGINHKGLCPFHGEKSPSFIVSPSRQTYHCFGCGVHGNAIGFLMEHSGLGFVDAIRDLAQEVGLSVPEDKESSHDKALAAAERQRQVTLTEVLAKAGDHYRKSLRDSPRAVEYLKARGLSGEIAARFGLGYALGTWRALASAFVSYDDPLLDESGLVISSGESTDQNGDTSQRKRYDRFRDRIMFPIRSVQGDVIGFGGRVLDKGEPKYLNSPETPVFSKGSELYGLYEARTALRRKNFALVVEGYMDVVSLAQHGFSNAVATLGTACTAEHLQKLFRFTDHVVFSFDGDTAGRRAARRALEAALPHAQDHRNIKFLFLAPEHDPDSYIREFGSDGFEHSLEQALPLSRYLLNSAQDGCDLDTAEGRARLLVNGKPLWNALPDGVLKRQMMGEFAVLSKLALAELSDLWIKDVTKPPMRDGAAKAVPRRPRLARHGATNLLDRALWLLIYQAEVWGQLDAASHDLLVEQAAPYGELFAEIERELMEQGSQAPAAILTALRRLPTTPAGQSTLERIAALHAPDTAIDLRNELHVVIERLRLDAVEEELKLMFESGDLSPDAQQRGAELMRLRASLKAGLAMAASSIK